MRRLRSFVFVQDEHGNSVTFGPDDAVPSWAATQITNPKAWIDGADAPAEESPAGAANDPARPPEKGPGSAREAWVAYAEALGFEIEDGATKADIIAAVDAV